ncbi:MAG: TolC family protein [Deltaproteobacteria bacterium]|nr:TolC family protein [Deltaproteobacteria bacterium]
MKGERIRVSRRRLILFGAAAAFALFCSPCLCEAQDKQKGDEAKDMSLADCVNLAVRHNRGVQSAYLDRVVQKFDLKVAEDEFVPNLTLQPSVKHASTGDGANRSYTNTGELAATITEKIPTGAEFTFTWADTTDRKYDDDAPEDNYKSDWNLSLKQPLLKGGGIDVNMASLETARINEQVYVLTLRSTISDTVTSAILAYRSFIQANEQLDITRKSVQRARELLEVNKELIEAGRMARVEQVQAEADLAGRRFDLTQAENSLDAARLALLKVLDIDRHTRVVPTEKIREPSVVHPDPERCRTLALENRHDYQQALLALKINELDLILARNNSLWDLSLEGAYGITGTAEDYNRYALSKSSNANRSDWNVGLTLSVPFGDLTRKQRIITAETALKKAKLDLEELRENVEIEVQDAVRDVEMKLRQVDLARHARELSEQKLDIEKEKLRAGLSSNFQLVTFQNDLLSAQNNELNAVINYLNALTTLDKTLETTLETWKIEVRGD